MKQNHPNQMKYGALISYVLIIGNTLFGLLVTPFVLKTLGSSSYGVYKTMGSLSTALLVLDLGIGSTLMRYIAKYRANNQNEKIGPFVSMMACEAGILIPVIAAVELVLYFRLDGIYSGSFSPAELQLGKQIFAVLSVNLIFNIIENLLNGIITGYNNFIFGNGIKLLKLLIRILLIFVLLPVSRDARILVGINMGLSLLGIGIEFAYIVKRYPLRLTFRVSTWEPGVFRESFVYTFLMFATVIMAQVNGNLDNVIVGAFCGAEQVAVYSFALVIFGMFEQLSTSVSGVALPTVSNLLAQEGGEKKIQEFIIQAGRVQFMMLGAAVAGYSVLGKEFLRLWLGTGFEDVYILVLILMIPSLFELCVNVCLTVLRAKNKLGFRTGILTLSTVLNIIISVAGMRYLGYFSAALGTAASFAVGSLLIMNMYYHRKFGFDMVRIYRGIMRRTWLCLLAAGAGCAVTARFFRGSWAAFVLNVMVFLLIYGMTMLAYGFAPEEKLQIGKMVDKRKRHK